MVDKVPHGSWHVTTMIGAIRLTGLLGGLIFEGATDASSFGTYVDQILLPDLKPGDIVIMDNLSSHKSQGVRATIEAAGATVKFLPPYSPDLNPIEKMWSKVKSLLRSFGKRTVDGLWDAICQAWGQITPQDSRGFFASCGIQANAT